MVFIVSQRGRASGCINPREGSLQAAVKSELHQKIVTQNEGSTGLIVVCVRLDIANNKCLGVQSTCCIGGFTCIIF